MRLAFQRFYRHPVTNIRFAYMVQFITLFINLLVSGSLLLSYLGAFSLLNLAIGLVAFTVYSSVVLRADLKIAADEDKKREYKYQKKTKKFDSTSHGRKITQLIKSFCRKLNIPLPHRNLKHINDATNAAVTSWPNANRIFLPKKMYGKIKDKVVDIKEIKFTLAHEISHIYYNHAFYSILLNSIHDCHRGVYTGYFLSACLTFFLLISTLMIPTFAVNIPLIANELIFFSICAVISKSVVVLSQFTNKAFVRAQETQADLKACEIIKPSEVYLDLKISEYLSSKDFKEKYYVNKKRGIADDTFSLFPEKISNFFRKNFKCYLNTHPKDTQRKKDVKLYFPEAAQTKHAKKNIKATAKRLAL